MLDVFRGRAGPGRDVFTALNCLCLSLPPPFAFLSPSSTFSNLEEGKKKKKKTLLTSQSCSKRNRDNESEGIITMPLWKIGPHFEVVNLEDGKPFLSAEQVLQRLE